MKSFIPGAMALAFLASFVSASGKLNVLFIVADDLNTATDEAITPHLDRLAARGLTFTRAYCQQAVCNPSRASFLTGLRPDTVGVDDLRKHFRNTAPNGKALVTLPQHFKNHGYFCQNIGKMFHNMGDTQDRQSWSVDERLHKGPHSADTVYQRKLKGKPAYKAPVTEAHDVPDNKYWDGQIADAAAEVLRRQKTSKQPFFLALGFWRPHLPFVAPKKYWDLYDPDKLTMPSPSTWPVDAPTIARHTSREIRGYGKVPKTGDFTEAQTRHFRHGYYASISFLDAQLGKVLDALDASGKTEETIIVFTSDHGFHIGEHSLWGKTSNFERDARVPLIIAAPGHAGGRSTESLAELIDLYPTLADLAGIKNDLPGNLEGASLAAIFENPKAEVKSAAFTQHQQPFYGSRENWKAWGKSVRTDRWRYTEWRSIDDRKVIARELYDHENDPGETKNVAGGNRDVVRKLAELLSR